jgi:MiaB/RimO family radical SAM methylthiotransferase
MKKNYYTCPMRTLECDRLASYLESQNNHDIVLIGACTVTKDVESHVLNAISSAKKKMIVCGCISESIRKAAVNAGAIEIINTTELHESFIFGDQRFPQIEMTKTHSVISDKALCNRQYENIENHNRNLFNRLLKKKTQIPFLVIARGCNNTCTYCHSRFYMGHLISKEINQIINEYKYLLKQSYRFINIIAGDVGSYGLDISTNLPKLLEALEKNTNDHRITWMLDGLQPKWYIKYKKSLANHIARKRLISISIPMQSGSNRMLGLMNRPQNRQEALDVLLEFKEQNPKLFLQCLFIVGFPGEEEEDFEHTLDFIKQVKFNDVTLIEYSEFDHCASSKITPKNSSSTINERIKRATNILSNLGIFIHE